MTTSKDRRRDIEQITDVLTRYATGIDGVAHQLQLSRFGWRKA
jgi:hypothetical protein